MLNKVQFIIDFGEDLQYRLKPKHFSRNPTETRAMADSKTKATGPRKGGFGHRDSMELVEKMHAESKTNKDIRATLKSMGFSPSRISQLAKKPVSKGTSMNTPSGKDIASKTKKTKKATK